MKVPVPGRHSTAHSYQIISPTQRIRTLSSSNKSDISNHLQQTLLHPPAYESLVPVTIPTFSFPLRPDMAKVLHGRQKFNAFMQTRKVRPSDLPSEEMNPNCKISIVIPSHDEPFSTTLGQRDPHDKNIGLLNLLFHLSQQKEIPIEEIEVLIVVNNSLADARNHTKEFQRNQDLIRFLNQMKNDLTPEEFSKLKIKKFDERRENNDNILKVSKVQISNLKIHVIDISSPEKAFPICNVGVARDYGALIAVERFRKTGLLKDKIITWFDADSTPTTGLLEKIKRTYQQTDCVAAIYDRHFYPPERDRKTLLRHGYEIGNWDYESLLNKVWMNLRQQEEMPSRRKLIMGGANLNMRADIFDQVGGIPHLNAAEDVLAAEKVARLGPVIPIQTEEPEGIFIPSRVSFRADAMGAHGQAVHKYEELSRKKNLQFLHPDYCFFQNDLFMCFEQNKTFQEFLDLNPNYLSVIKEDEYILLQSLYKSYLNSEISVFQAFNFEAIYKDLILKRAEREFGFLTYQQIIPEILKLKIPKMQEIGSDALQQISETLKMEREQYIKQENVMIELILRVLESGSREKKEKQSIPDQDLMPNIAKQISRSLSEEFLSQIKSFFPIVYKSLQLEDPTHIEAFYFEVFNMFLGIKNIKHTSYEEALKICARKMIFKLASLNFNLEMLPPDYHIRQFIIMMKIFTNRFEEKKAKE